VNTSLMEVSETERIIPTAIQQRLTVGADGELQPLVEGSTKAVAMTVTHAGIARVRRYGFSLA
jgi:hypothetical protein